MENGMGYCPAEYARKVLCAAAREMEREMALLLREGMPPRMAGMSERFLAAQDAARSAGEEARRWGAGGK